MSSADIKISLRPLSAIEVPEVVAIQRDAYVHYLQEDEVAFHAKRDLYPDGFVGAFIDNQLAGYSISFPWFQDTPVALHTTNISPDNEFDCYYMHDVAVLSQFRGLGIADKLVNRCLDTARELGLYTVRMVTVQGGENVWSRYGFEVYGTADESYGPNAFKMSITLAH